METAVNLLGKTKGENHRRTRHAALALVVRHEWRQMSRDKTLWIVGVLLSALMIYAAFNGAAWIDFQRNTLSRAQKEETERLDSMQSELRQIDAGQAKPKMFRDPARPGWVGEFLGTRYAALPPLSLAALSVGQRDLYPYYFKVSTLSADNFLNEDEIENPFNLLTGRFDLAFVIVYLLPLFILALSYNLLAGEKESGTLPLALSQPFGLARLLIGKIGARFAFIAALAVVLSVLGASLTGADLSEAETIFRIVLWSVAITLYSLFWFATAALVNAFGKSSATNAIALASVWLAFVVIIPAFLTLAVSRIYPVESRLAFITAMREDRRSAAARTGDVLAEFYSNNPDLKPANTDKNDFMPGFYAAQIERDKKFLPLFRNYETQLSRQNHLAENLRVLSPSLALQSALNDLAGSGFYRYHNFIAQIHEFHAEWQLFFLPKLFRRERLTADDYERFPKFTFADEPRSKVLHRILFGLGAITILTLIIGLLASRRLKAFPVAN